MFQRAVIIHVSFIVVNDFFENISCQRKKSEPSRLNSPYQQQWKPQSKKFCWLHSATASCFSKSLLKINSICEIDIHSLRQTLWLQWYSKRRPISSRCISLGYKYTEEREKYFIYCVHLSKIFWKVKGKLFVPLGVRVLCIFANYKKYSWLCWIYLMNR